MSSNNTKRKISLTKEDQNQEGTTCSKTKYKKIQVENCIKCVKNRSSLKCAGPYVLGPSLARSPVKSIVQCLSRRMNSDDFYTIKLLTLSKSTNVNCQNDMKQGKMLIHTEYSLLSLLHSQEGVIHTHGLFQDEVIPENSTTSDNEQPSSKCKRLCLVLDCLEPHNYCQSTQDYENLQSFVIKEKKLCERKALVVFLDIVKVVKDLHEVFIYIF